MRDPETESSPSSGHDGAASARALRLIALRATPLSLDEVRAAVVDRGAGGTAFFSGTVRDEDEGRGVVELEYSAHPSAARELRRVAERVASRYPVQAVAALHRTGTLAIGDLAVLVAVACPHRAEAFQACRELIDTLKHEVPIWKRQNFEDGSQEWVGVAGC